MFNLGLSIGQILNIVDLVERLSAEMGGMRCSPLYKYG